MNKRVFALATLLMTTPMLSLISARADTPSDPTPQLAKIYAKLDDAADRKNIDVCMAALSPDFLLLNLDGKVEDSDGQRAHLTQIFSQFNQLEVTTKILRCDFTDKTATVEISQHVKATPPADDSGKASVLEGDLNARELWTKDADGWKMDVAQTLAGGQLTPDP